MGSLEISVSVLTLVSTVVACLDRIKILHGAPREIHKPADEVADLRIVVQEVANTLQHHEQSLTKKTSTPLRSETTANLLSLLSRAKVKLVELDEILNEQLLVSNTKSGNVRYVTSPVCLPPNGHPYL